MYVCIFVCIYILRRNTVANARIHIHMHTCTYARTCVHKNTYIHVHVRNILWLPHVRRIFHMFVHIHIQRHRNTRTKFLHAYSNRYMHIYVYNIFCKHVCMLHVCRYMHVCYLYVWYMHLCMIHACMLLVCMIHALLSQKTKSCCAWQPKPPAYITSIPASSHSHDKEWSPSSRRAFFPPCKKG